MSNYAEIYSEHGLKKMIEDNMQKIIESKKEHQEVCEGTKYNPLCADGWKTEIEKDIKRYENNIIKLEEALKIQQQVKAIK